MKSFSLVLILIFSFYNSAAFAWGAYAHQQINVEAALLFYADQPGNPMAACMHKNQELIQRLAITPDYDWKVVGTAPTDDASVTARQASDKYEHPLHFFEADAFAANSSEFIDLPSGDFQSVLSKYQELVKGRHEAIAAVDPSKTIKDLDNITVEDVTVHGTAPWRIVQMYGLAVSLLSQCKPMDSKDCDLEKALTYLGAMGHYVGDMSQPLHASLNYDGQYNPPQHPSKAVGLHSGFETEMFNLLNGKADLEDKTEFTFPQFDNTQNAVNVAARGMQKDEPLEVLDKTQIIPRVFNMIAGGYDIIPSMVSHFADEVVAYPTRPVNKKTTSTTTAAQSTTTKTKSSTSTRKPGSVITTLQFAENRMGAAAALLARLWLSAEHDAGDPDIKDCAVIPFNRANVIQAYQIPDYLPAGHQKLPPNRSTGEPPSSHPSTKAIKAFTKELL